VTEQAALSSGALELIGSLVAQAQDHNGQLSLADAQAAFDERFGDAVVDDEVEAEEDEDVEVVLDMAGAPMEVAPRPAPRPGEKIDPGAFLDALIAAGVDLTDDIDADEFDAMVAFAEQGLVTANVSADATLDAYSQMKRELGYHPRLSREEEVALARRYRFLRRTHTSLLGDVTRHRDKTTKLEGRVAAIAELIELMGEGGDDDEARAAARETTSEYKRELAAVSAEFDETSKVLAAAVEEVERADAEAKRVEDTFIRHNTRLAMKWAGKVWGQAHHRPDYLDLVQQGVEGMIKAFRRFDPDKGYKFSTWATWMIREKQQTYSYEQVGGGARIPGHRHRDLRAVRRFVSKFEAENGHKPTNEEIAVGAWREPKSVKTVAEILQADIMNRPVSLYAPVGEDGDATIGDFIADTNSMSAERIVMNQALGDAFETSLVNLKARERRVIMLRFGLYDKTPRTLEWIGRRMNITRERVRQIQETAFRKLRRDPVLREMAPDLAAAYDMGGHEIDSLMAV
jgi:RNA polymerase primary sigma factor